jgi:hypothetical protein
LRVESKSVGPGIAGSSSHRFCSLDENADISKVDSELFGLPFVTQELVVSTELYWPANYPVV